jgi:GDSL-like Lipase/Acylhydrolase family
VRELGLAAGSLLLGVAVLCVAEWVARRLDPRFLDRTRGATVYSEIYGWALRPGFSGEIHGVTTNLNRRGFRGMKHAVEKAPGRLRVLMLGDSITFGTRVRDGETFSALLEARTKRFEVANLAVEGYGTDQELLLLEREAPGFRPDVVVLNFCLHNDVLNNSLPWDHQDGYSPKPWFVLEGDEVRHHGSHLVLPPLRRVAQWLRDESHLYGRLFAAPPDEPPPAASIPDALFDRPTAYRLTVRLVDRMRTLTRQSGARFLALLHPDEPGFLEPARLTAKLRAEPLLAGIPIVDLGERYRAGGHKLRDMLLDFQGHLTPRGHLVAVWEIETLLAGAVQQRRE